jgi:hypothetical protein
VRLPGVSASAGSVVRMLGNSRELSHHVDGDDLVIAMPDHLPASPATVFAITGAR